MKKTLAVLTLSAALCGNGFAASEGLAALRNSVPGSDMADIALPAPAAEKASPEKVKCGIRSLSDAKKCMQKLADSYPAYEEPNDGLASNNVEGLVKVLKLLGRDEAEIRQAKKADFAGLMVEHGDEHHIYYYALKKGNSSAPVELYDMNVVDMEYMLEKPYSAEALNPDTYFLGIEHNDCAYSELAEYLSELTERKASLKYGPYIAESAGENLCQVTPDAVTKIAGSKKEVTPLAQALNAKELEAYIKAAKREPLVKTGMHIMATIPPVKISAGIFPATSAVDLYVDSSDIRERKGSASAHLLGIIRKYCGQF